MRMAEDDSDHRDNLWVVCSAAVARAAAAADDVGVTATVVDTVTGRVLHQQHQRGAAGPVAAAFFDNVAMLQFWDARAFRWHFAVLELYEHGVQLPTTLKMVTGAG
jgi:hypothetical protein